MLTEFMLNEILLSTRSFIIIPGKLNFNKMVCHIIKLTVFICILKQEIPGFWKFVQ